MEKGNEFTFLVFFVINYFHFKNVFKFLFSKKRTFFPIFLVYIIFLSFFILIMKISNCLFFLLSPK